MRDSLSLSLVALLALGGCLRGAEERALSDLDIGQGQGYGLTITVAGGLAHIRELTPDGVHLWAAAPDLSMTVAFEPTAARAFSLTIDNCMPDAELFLATDQGVADTLQVATTRPTSKRWDIVLSADVTRLDARVAPPDADSGERFTFAVMSDVQRAMDRVDEVFERIDAEPDVRFVISAGDLVSRGRIDEYDLWEQKLEHLRVPYYSTIGNHELMSDPERWRTRFGRFNLFFRFKRVSFALVDSGSASIDPIVYDWLDDWLDAPGSSVHVFATHYPPTDPVGVRGGAFASHKEALKLLARLARGQVDLTLYGHIHSYYAYENAGIPAYISGGGGAWPEIWDGVGRHFLAVEASSEAVHRVALVRVD